MTWFLLNYIIIMLIFLNYFNFVLNLFIFIDSNIIWIINNLIKNNSNEITIIFYLFYQMFLSILYLFFRILVLYLENLSKEIISKIIKILF